MLKTTTIPNHENFYEQSSQMSHDFEKTHSLLDIQTPETQQTIIEQAHLLANVLIQQWNQVKFTLPERIRVEGQNSQKKTNFITPEEMRYQSVGKFKNHTSRVEIVSKINAKLDQLADCEHKGISLIGTLLRYATANYLVQNIVPRGQMIVYQVSSEFDVPNIPIEFHELKETADYNLPRLPSAAQLFYLPQWVNFDEKDNLIVNTLVEAEANLTSLKQCLDILSDAKILYPPIVVTDEYQTKHYGILGQLVNQGRAMARFHAKDIISIIFGRVSSNDLNRGLSLTVPYFDDHQLVMKSLDFEVIPAGRIQFVPAFLVCAVRQEQEKVVEDSRYNVTTKQHLISLLKMIEHAFESKYSPHTGGIGLKIFRKGKIK